MRGLSLILLLALAGCVVGAREQPLPSARRNLTEDEVRALPPGTKFKDVEKRLRYFTRSAIAVPLISFVLEEERKRDCIMLFAGADDHLESAWVFSGNPGDPKEETVLWPKSEAEKRLLEGVDPKERRQANQSSTAQRP